MECCTLNKSVALLLLEAFTNTLAVTRLFYPSLLPYAFVLPLFTHSIVLPQVADDAACLPDATLTDLTCWCFDLLNRRVLEGQGQYLLPPWAWAAYPFTFVLLVCWFYMLMLVDQCPRARILFRTGLLFLIHFSRTVVGHFKPVTEKLRPTATAEKKGIVTKDVVHC